MELTKITVFKYLDSDNEFPIDFDNAWMWVGYTRKENALNKLLNNFDIGVDFIEEENIFSPNGEKIARGRKPDKYYITIDCFKAFCMMAGTSKGKEVRKYFLDCEKELKKRIYQESSKNSRRFILDMYIGNPREWTKQFKLTFYENIHRLKGWEFTENRYNPYVGKLTIDLVYQRIQPGLWDELKIKNPNKTKIRYHQLLTENIGNPHLREHIRGIVRLMESCNNWTQFEHQLDRQFPKTMDVQLDLFFDLMAENNPEEFEKWQHLLDQPIDN